MRQAERTLGAAALCILVLPAAAGAFRFSGEVAGFQYVDAAVSVTTTSATFIPVPEMELTFETRRDGAALVQFCTETFVVADTLLVAIELDANVLSPGAALLDEDSDADGNGVGIRTHCFTWSGEARRGIHRVRAIWRVGGGPFNEATLGFRSLVVWHGK